MQKNVKSKFSFFLILLASLFLLIGLGTVFVNGQGVAFANISAAAPTSILYETTDIGTLYIFNDNNVGHVILLNEDGTIKEQAQTTHEIVHAVAVENELYLFVPDGNGSIIELVYLLDDLTDPLYDLSLPVSFQDLVAIDCDLYGNVYIAYKNTNQIKVLDAAGTQTFEKTLPYPITYLQVLDNNLYYYAGTSFYQSDIHSPNQVNEQTYDTSPLKLLSSRYLLDQKGNVLDLSLPRLEILLTCSDDPALFPAPFLFYSLSVENCLIWSNQIDEISKCTLSGRFEGLYQMDGDICAVGPTSAITVKDNTLYMTKYDTFQEATPKPTEPSEAESSQLTSSVPLPDLDTDGDYIYLHEGITVKKLKELFQSENIIVRDALGAPVKSGVLGTSMEVEQFIIIIPGDINGSGTVNSADIKLAQKLFLNPETQPVSEIQVRAADLDRDGSVTTSDLTQLSNLIASLAP